MTDEAAAPIDWLAEAPLWTGFLRDHRFGVTVADDLAVSRLVAILRDERVAIPDAAAAARWLGPLLCRSADDQSQLLALLLAWHAQRDPNPPTPAPLPAHVERALPAPLQSRKLFLWVGFAVLLGLIGLGIALMPRNNPTGTGEQTPAPIVASRPMVEELASRGVAAATILVPFALLLGLRWRDRVQRLAAVRGLAPSDAPREALQIRLDNLSLFRPESVQPGVADLRRHRTVPAHWIDPARSVQATVESGGFVRLVPGSRPVTPEHLLLVDLVGRDDVLGLLADLIAQRLRDGGVQVTRFDYQGDPRRLRRVNGEGTRRVDLEELRVLYPDHRLLILSDATSFGDVDGERQRSWVADLLRWPQAGLLTPVPAGQWGPRERALIRLGLRVAEATPDGVRALARELRTDLPRERATPGAAEAPRFDRLIAANPHRWFGDRSPPQEEVDALLRALHGVLGETGFFFLASLAVFPVVHPKLTLALGRVLATGSGEAVLSDQTLALLARVPWLRRARLPDWLRLALVLDLRRRPVEEQAARAAWSTLMQPKSGDETLPVEVVRVVDPALPRFVGALLSREGPYRETILIAFMNGETLPDLAIELPARLDAMMRRAVPRVDLCIATVALAAAFGVAASLHTLNHAVNTFEASLLPTNVQDWLETALPVAGLVLGAASLAAWYWPLLVLSIGAIFVHGGIGLGGEPISIEHRSHWALSLALLCLGAELVAGLFGSVNLELLSRVWLAASLVAFCADRSGEWTLAWAPPIVAFGIRATSLNWLDFSLAAAFVVGQVALRAPWPTVLRMLRCVAPCALLPLTLGDGVQIGIGPGFFLVLWLGSRFLSDPEFRNRCLVTDRLTAGDLAVLLLPMMVEGSFGPLAWNAAWLVTFVAFGLGLSRASLVPLFPLIAVTGSLMLTLHVYADKSENLGLILVDSMLAWPGGTVTVLLGLAAGRILIKALLASPVRWTKMLAAALLILGLAGHGVWVSLQVRTPGVSGSSFSSPLVYGTVFVPLVITVQIVAPSLAAFALGIGGVLFVMARVLTDQSWTSWELVFDATIVGWLWLCSRLVRRHWPSASPTLQRFEASAA